MEKAIRHNPVKGVLYQYQETQKRKGIEMNGFDMMCDLADYLGELCVLEELSRYLSNDVVVDAMQYIAKKYDYSFDGEE